jgi:hypothetical protein
LYVLVFAFFDIRHEDKKGSVLSGSKYYLSLIS